MLKVFSIIFCATAVSVSCYDIETKMLDKDFPHHYFLRPTNTDLQHNWYLLYLVSSNPSTSAPIVSNFSIARSDIKDSFFSKLSLEVSIEFISAIQNSQIHCIIAYVSLKNAISLEFGDPVYDLPSSSPKFVIEGNMFKLLEVIHKGEVYTEMYHNIVMKKHLALLIL